MNSSNDVSSTGIWWRNPWWETPAYSADSGLSSEEIHRRIEALKQVFTADWTRAAHKAGRPNVVLPLLNGGTGLLPFDALMWLGQTIHRLKDVPTLHRPVNELNSPKSRSALFEIEIASWFAGRDYQIEFPKPSTLGKTPDLRLGKGDVHASVECKCIRPEQWEGWAERLSHCVLDRIRDRRIPHNVSFDVLFDPRLSDLNFSSEHFRTEIIDEIADRIAKVLASTHPVPDNVHTLRLPGVARIEFFRDRPATQYGVGGIEVSPQAKMRKILQNAILEGAAQLPPDDCGIVAVHSNFAPPHDLADVVLTAAHRAEHDRFKSIAYVVIVGPIDLPVVWQNPDMITRIDATLDRDVRALFGGSRLATMSIDFGS